MSKLSRRSVALLAFACGVLVLPRLALADEVDFRGEARLFSDFEFDSGFQPTNSPVQLRVVFNLGGGLTASAKGDVYADSQAQMSMSGVPGTGRYELNVGPEFRVFIRLRFSVLGRDINYEGPIPINLPLPTELDYRFAGSADFDPFLLDGSAAVIEDEVQDTTLVEIPLTDAIIPVPGIGGSLVLELGGRLRSEFTGVSAELSESWREGDVVRSHATYRGKAKHTGTVIIKPGLRVSVLSFSRDLSLSFPVDIPGIEQDIDLGSVPVRLTIPSGDEPASPGPGGLEPGAGGGSGGGGGGAGATDGPGASGPDGEPGEDEAGMTGGCSFVGSPRDDSPAAPWILLAVALGLLSLSRRRRGAPARQDHTPPPVF